MQQTDHQIHHNHRAEVNWVYAELLPNWNQGRKENNHCRKRFKDTADYQQ